MVYAKFRRKIQQKGAGKQPSVRRESGQAAIFALILIPTAIAAVLLVFNTGQVTASKLRVQNAADAAAFSAMELEARQMNLDAYLNRAMLANEVAIGQAVSILSWSRYAKSVGDNIQPVFRTLSTLPIIGQLFDAWGQVTKVASQAVYVTGTGYASVFLPVANGMDAVYAGAEQVFNLALGQSNIVNGPVQQTVKQVVEINAPGAEVIAYPATAVKYWLDRRNFVTTWGGSKDPKGRDPGGRTRMASMVNESARQQVFTVNRDHDMGFPLTFDILPWFPGSVRIHTHKSGGGQLAKDRNGNYVWSAADSISTKAQIGSICGFFPHPCWPTVFDRSWGWGGAWSLPSLSSFGYYQSDPVRWNGWQDPIVDPQASGNAKTVQMPSYRVYQDAWFRDGRGMNQVAQDFSVSLPTDASNLPFGRGGEGGIAQYRDLVWQQRTDPQKDDMTDTAPKYIVLVSLPTKNVHDSVTTLEISSDPTQGGQTPSLGWMGMRLDTQGAGKLGNKGVRAVAAAQVYFRRPNALWPRNDGLDERANLFSPFWSARLVDLTKAERTSILLISSQT
ncbi:pilus assembly protein TadG-related protein [Acidithiobacillus sp. M4-SHS-6]|uniref:pilus assembly protein TadG-related protein n=1 Tax=Acidithiobacillus sp. M4-SHS-6 TaxID=3383024 RepID=UPI0039BDA5A2